jgi:5-methylcytosine-specific restriction endonuclease McrA
MLKKSKCLSCEIEFEHGHSHTGKYCSIACASVYRSSEHKKKFFSGLLEKRIDRPTARKYLAEVRGYKCEICSLSDWQGKKITLHVDHVNGDPSNDHPDNLRLLCPNCHSQTEFLGGANKGRGRKSQGLPLY